MRYRTDSFSASKDSQIDSQNEKQPKKRLKHWAVGTGGRTRTDTVLPPPDFESGASTSFATSALLIYRKICNSEFQIYAVVPSLQIKNGKSPE